jgi:hypothetical protein
MSTEGLRSIGVEATATDCVLGRLAAAGDTGAGAFKQIPLASLSDGIAAASAFAQSDILTAADAGDLLTAAGITAPITILGDYSDETVLAGIVTALVASGLFIDGTTP